jgi:XTP/dITP diphosphohydrolase
MKEVYLATRNNWKIKVARKAIEEQYGIVVVPRNLDVSEIQNDDPTIIARASVKEAYQILGAPVIKCESGLHILGLNGFPGPYSNYVERTLGIDGLLQVCAPLASRNAKIYSVIAFCDHQTDSVIFYDEMPGILLREKRGVHGYFFDSIFVPKDYEQSLAEIDDAERWVFWKGAYEKFAEWYILLKD